MPKAYGYCRASTGRQDLTFDVQKAAIERYYEGKLKQEGFEWGGAYEDKDVSGAQPFTERPKGRELFVLAQPGDAIIWHKMDRAFRSVMDGANTFNLLKTKGIAVHSLDIQLDTSTAMGSFVCHLMMLLGELERSWISTRTREALEARKARGLPPSCSLPPGWKSIGVGKERHLVPDIRERQIIEMVRAKFLSGMTLEKISNELYFKKIKRIRNSPTKRKATSEYDRQFLEFSLMARAEGYPVTASIMAWKKTIGKVKLTKPFRVRLLEMEEQHAQASGSSS
jgi:DNA invertase Pin-like site-specific DNA recombinase